MPDDHDITIDANGNPCKEPLECKPGDTITWTNKYSKPITEFKLPPCVCPKKSPAPIAVGTSTLRFLVKHDQHGKFKYKYRWDHRSPRFGTIDVGAR
jgi:hypothetical protein